VQNYRNNISNGPLPWYQLQLLRRALRDALSKGCLWFRLTGFPRQVTGKRGHDFLSGMRFSPRSGLSMKSIVPVAAVSDTSYIRPVRCARRPMPDTG
jgi:hypothetical protein